MSNRDVSINLTNYLFNRSLTRDLLAELSNEQLLLSPSPNLGALWKQFRHIGRVQENYMSAYDTGVVKFSTEGARFDKSAPALSGGDALLQYLKALDEELDQRLMRRNLPETIDWFGEEISAEEHFARLESHETLHHGQLIVYCQALNIPFPKSWSVWGLA